MDCFAYYKINKCVITIYDSFAYYKLRQRVITILDNDRYYNSLQFTESYFTFRDGLILTQVLP